VGVVTPPEVLVLAATAGLIAMGGAVAASLLILAAYRLSEHFTKERHT
jgi:hypothetical protein